MKKHITLTERYFIAPTLLLFCFFSSLSLSGQTKPALKWDKTYGGSHTDMLTHIIETADGGYLAGGSSVSGSSGDKSQDSLGYRDYWIVKLNSAGQKMWDKTYGSALDEILTGLVQTADGGYLLGGMMPTFTYSPAPYYTYDYHIMKLDSAGNVVWEKIFGTESDDYLTCLIQTSDNGYLLGGYSKGKAHGDKSSYSRGGEDYWIIKTDSLGNKIWDKTYGGENEDILTSIQQTTDGGYILGGYSHSSSTSDKFANPLGKKDYWVLKVDAGGGKIWDHAYGGASNDILLSVRQTYDGGYILGGYSDSNKKNHITDNSKGFNDFWIVKTGVNGRTEWSKTIGSYNEDFCYFVQQTYDYGYIAGGTSYSGIGHDKSETMQGAADFWIVKMDHFGNVHWDKTIGGSGIDYFALLKQTDDEGYIIGGYSYSGQSGHKTDSCRGDSDFWIVKLDSMNTYYHATSVTEDAAAMNIHIYPNPTNGEFTLHLDGLKHEKVHFALTDLAGKQLLQQELHQATGAIRERINTGLSAGMYLLHIQAGHARKTYKLLIE